MYVCMHKVTLCICACIKLHFLCWRKFTRWIVGTTRPATIINCQTNITELCMTSWTSHVFAGFFVVDCLFTTRTGTYFRDFHSKQHLCFASAENFLVICIWIAGDISTITITVLINPLLLTGPAKLVWSSSFFTNVAIHSSTITTETTTLRAFKKTLFTKCIFSQASF